MLQTQWRKQHWSVWLECRKIILFFPYLNIYYLLKPMQIYGILLNICGILLNNRGKNREIRRISWNFVEFSRKIRGKSFLFIPFLSSTSSWMTHFRGRFRSFSVVFAVISGENRRISEKNGEYRGNLSVFFPFLSTSLHFHSFLFLNP